MIEIREVIRLPKLLFICWLWVAISVPNAQCTENANARLLAYCALTVDEQQAEIERIAALSTATLTERLFLRAAVACRQLAPHIRNNIADVLRLPLWREPTIWRLYVAMANDVTESDINRNYAVQYLAATYEFADEPSAIAAELYHLVDSSVPSLCSTAALQICQLYQQQKLPTLRENFSKKIAQLLHRDKLALEDQVTLICILGEIATADQLPLLRQLAALDRPEAVKRTALAALGERGDLSDMPLIMAATTHKNIGVALSARAAAQRLNERFSPDK